MFYFWKKNSVKKKKEKKRKEIDLKDGKINILTLQFSTRKFG